MALDDDIRILSGVELFRGFTHEQLRLLAFGAETMHLAAGRQLFAEGEAADSAFVVAEGSIGLYRERDGKRLELGAVGDGAILGELALIADTARPTGATVLADSLVVRLNRKLFRRILEEYPETAAMLHQRIAANLGEMLAEIERLSPRFAG